jgi:hypothetical protein
MFIIPTYYDGQKSKISETIESIKFFHPNEKIVICDSDSPVKGYEKNYITDNVEFFNAKNNRRPFGALLETYKKYPNEDNYILIHDTTSLLSNIDNFIKNDSLITSFLFAYKPIQYLVPQIRNEYFVWIENLMNNTKYDFISDIRTDENYLICVGSMGIYKNKILDRFFKVGLYENFNSFSFNEGQFSERAIGYFCKIEGIDIEKNTIEGNVHEKWDGLVNGNLQYLKKTFNGR